MCLQYTNSLRTLQLLGKEHFSNKDTYCYPKDRGVWLEGIDSIGKLEEPTGSLLTVVVGLVTHWYPTDSRGRLEVHTGTLTVEVS